jgi:5-methylcytosine-specific restriction endonuclease McrA
LTNSELCGIINTVEYAVCFNLPTYISLPKQPVSSTNILVNRWADIFIEDKMDTKVCSKCGVEKPLDEFNKDKSGRAGRRSICKICGRLAMKLYYQTPAFALSMMKYRQSEKYRQTLSAYRQSSLVYQEYQKAYHQSDVFFDYIKEYKRSPRGKANDARCNHRRRSRVKELLCDLTAAEWEEIKLAQNYKCAMCGELKFLQRDHIVPLSKGGGLTKSNVQGLCINCNASKSDKLPKEDTLETKPEDKATES